MATTFAVPDGRVAMAATLYTGNGSTQAVSNAVNTVSFQPDLVWVKNRSNAVSHALIDSVRGAPNQLAADLTAAQNSGGNDYTLYGGVSALSSAGFTASSGTDPTYKATNGSGQTYVGWQWKAGGTAVSNTAGTITSSVSANTTAGFSVVTYTGTGAGTSTVGHGLGVAPSLILVKNRSAAGPSWAVYHASIPTQYLVLNITDAAQAGQWISPTATTISYSSLSSWTGNASATYVAYCWAPVAGYSAFGSYTGNGSADGPFVYTGFLPRFILIKVSSTTGNWRILDTARSPSNVESLELYPSLANAESSFAILDGLSNGFKIRNSDVNYNNSGSTYIYAAFAENPLKYSNAR